MFLTHCIEFVVLHSTVVLFATTKLALLQHFVRVLRGGEPTLQVPNTTQGQFFFLFLSEILGILT